MRTISCDRTWYFIKDTPGVIGFAGTKDKPIPMRQSKWSACSRRCGARGKGEAEGHFEVGEIVKVADGPFQNQNGIVEEIDPERGKLRVSVTIFGRATPVELEYWQVERGKSEGLTEVRVVRVSRIRNPINSRFNALQYGQGSNCSNQTTDPRWSANPAPPVGTALGQHGVNIMAFCKEFNAATQKQAGDILPVVITVYKDKSFTFITKSRRRVLIKKALNIAAGSKNRTR